MQPRAILVNFDIDHFDLSLARYAIDLAERFEAKIVGLCAAEPLALIAGAQGGITAKRIFREMTDEIEAQLVEHKQAFYKIIPPKLNGGWLGVSASPNQTLIAVARGADLILMGRPTPEREDFATSRRAEIGDVVLSAGRPVMAIPAGQTQANLETVLIGWKDTREARRAIADALPLMTGTSRVVVMTVNENNDLIDDLGIHDVVHWLERHGISVETDIRDGSTSTAAALLETAHDIGAGMIVTGAYGHSRLRESIFGGVTRSLLSYSTIVRFLSN